MQEPFASILSIIIVLAPWAVSVLLVYRLAITSRFASEVATILALSGGFLFLWLCVLFLSLELWYLPLAILASMPLLILAMRGVETSKNNVPLSLVTALAAPPSLSSRIVVRAAVVALTSSIGIAIFLATQVPTSGWDALWFWSEVSAAFAATDLGESAVLANRVTNHPLSTSVLAAWSGWVSHVLLARSYISYLPWIVVWCSLIVIVFAYALHETRNIIASILFSLITATVPLLTNHALIGGYAEIFVVFSVSFVSLLSKFA